MIPGAQQPLVFNGRSMSKASAEVSATRHTPQLSSQLRAALERLADGKMWDGAGNLCGGKNCAWTAQESMEAARFFTEILGFSDHKQVFNWNDAPERTWPEVKAAFEKAIAKAEGRSQ